MGHWTFECTKSKVYLYRPSKTQQLRNPELKTKEVFEAGPDSKPVFDGDFKRSTRPKKEEESSSSSSSDDERQVY